MLGHHVDFLGENGNLHRRGTRVLGMETVLGDEVLLRRALKGHRGTMERQNKRSSGLPGQRAAESAKVSKW